MQQMNPISQPVVQPRFSLRSLFNAITVAAICIGLLSALVAFVNSRAEATRARLARFQKFDKETVVSIVKQVEAIRAKLGRAPNDQVELESLLGRRMPMVHDGEYKTSISYMRTGTNSFVLQYELLETDDWIYDSKMPNAGWVQHWY